MGVLLFDTCAPAPTQKPPASSLCPLLLWLPAAEVGSTCSICCPLPWAPLGRHCRRIPVSVSRGQCRISAATSAFCCLPSPAFSRLQVTASQGALKVLCSHFLLLWSSCLTFQSKCALCDKGFLTAEMWGWAKCSACSSLRCLRKPFIPSLLPRVTWGNFFSLLIQHCLKI